MSLIIMELHVDRTNDSPPEFSVRAELRRRQMMRDAVIAIAVGVVATERGVTSMRDRVVTCYSFEEGVLILYVWEECG